MILIGLQAGYQGIVCAYYAFQKEQITEKYCVNKAKPALKCNGKCHLKTMLAAQEEHTENAPNKKNTSLKEISLQPLIGLLQPLPNWWEATRVSIRPIATTTIGRPATLCDRLAIEELLDPPRRLNGTIHS